MKIIIPNYRIPDSFVDNVAFTLENEGHEVITMGQVSNEHYNSKLASLYRFYQEKKRKTKHYVQEKWLNDILKNVDFKADILLALTMSINQELLFLAKKKNVITIAWWGDTAANMQGPGLLTKGWDFIYIKDKFASTKIKSLGLNAFHLNEAMNPEWHTKLYNSINKNLLIAGSFYDYRNYLAIQLLHYNIPLELYGRKLPSWADASLKKLHSGAFIVREEKSRRFGEALACINSTAMSEFNSMNCRAFEIAGAGGLQFMEYRPAIEQCFVIDEEIKVFRSIHELVALYRWAIDYPHEALSIREKGRARALAEHTYKHRLDLILNQAFSK